MAAGDATQSTDEQILWMVRAGMVDAEIAARLNIPTGDVKQRIERLAKRHGVDGREGLRASSLLLPDKSAQRSRSDTFLRRFGSYAVVGVVCAVLGAAVVSAVDPRGTPGAPKSAPEPAATPTTAPPAASRPTVVINGASMVDAGRFVYSKRTLTPVFDVSERAGFVVLSLQPGAYLTGDGDIQWVPSSQSGKFQLQVAGETLDLVFLAANDSTGVQETSTEVAVFTRDDDLPAELMLWAHDRGGVLHSVHVDSAGELFVSVEPIAPEIAIESSTGEALELGGTTSRGRIRPAAMARPANWCLPFPTCVSTFDYPIDLQTPVAGEVTCPDRAFDASSFAPGPPRVVQGQVLTLRATGYTLHFLRRAFSVNGIAPGDLLCPDATRVDVGDPLLAPGNYTLIATGIDGQPTDVAIDGNLAIHVGPITPKFGCPCLWGD